MTKFIIGTLIVLVLWYFFSTRSKARSYLAHAFLGEAEPWLNKEDIKPLSVRYEIYKEPQLAKNEGATALVGSGTKTDGSKVGFIVEVVPGAGVVEGVYLEPYIIASQHVSASRLARMRGVSLIDIMQEMAHQHRIKHSVNN